MEITAPQARVLCFLRRFLRDNGFMASRGDLKRGLKLAGQSNADLFLKRIERRGWLRLNAGVNRGVHLLRERVPLYEPEDFRTTTVLVRGRDETAREPDWIDCEHLWRLFGTMPDLCLRIRGDAMELAGLTDGGLVAIRLASDGDDRAPPTDGDVVAARAGEYVVLRRFHRVNETTAELRPESTNPEHRVLCVGAEANDAEIIGVVTGRMLAGGG
ncbi:MAG: hypothetical protein OXU81_13630 [Gammaproteobacteria bacterium]|nr:hypothetical protein [Gammaproteobacteria bacterium]